MDEYVEVEGSFWIFDTAYGDALGGDENTSNGTSIGPFKTQEEAVAHAEAHTASWASWQVGQVTVVHTYVPPEEDEFEPDLSYDEGQEPDDVEAPLDL